MKTKHYYLQIKKFIDYIQIKGYFSAKISCIAQVTFNVTLNKYLCLGTGMFFFYKIFASATYYVLFDEKLGTSKKNSAKSLEIPGFSKFI